jgi:ribosomal protein S3
MIQFLNKKDLTKFSYLYIYIFLKKKKKPVNLFCKKDINYIFQKQIDKVNNLYNNLWNLKKISITRKKIFLPIFNIIYIWANSWSLAYYIQSQFSRGLNISSILYSIKKNIPYNIKGILIQVTGRMTGASRATKKKYMFGSTCFSSLNAKTEYAYLKVQSRFGMSSIKVWLNQY